jgi:hypothetical protein
MVMAESPTLESSMMRLLQLVLATALVASGSVACARQPDRLPDLVGEFTPLYSVALSHVAENGGPPVTLGPVHAQGSDLFVTGACLGGGEMTIRAVVPGRPQADWVTGTCNGDQMLGVTFYIAQYDRDSTPDVFCIVPSFEGTVTAWEVFVGQSKNITIPYQTPPTLTPTSSPTPKTTFC